MTKNWPKLLNSRQIKMAFTLAGEHSWKSLLSYFNMNFHLVSRHNSNKFSKIWLGISKNGVYYEQQCIVINKVVVSSVYLSLPNILFILIHYSLIYRKAVCLTFLKYTLASENLSTQTQIKYLWMGHVCFFKFMYMPFNFKVKANFVCKR